MSQGLLGFLFGFPAGAAATYLATAARSKAASPSMNRAKKAAARVEPARREEVLQLDSLACFHKSGPGRVDTSERATDDSGAAPHFSTLK